jgi:hypothetical protein
MEMDLDVSLWSGARNWSNFVAPICKLYAFIFYMLTFVVHIILAYVCVCVCVCARARARVCVRARACMCGWAGVFVGCTCQVSHKSCFIRKSSSEGNVQIRVAHTS